MSRIETRCTECGARDVRRFTYHGLEPPAFADRCGRCAATPVTVVMIDEAELSDDTRTAPHPAGGTFRVSEAAEALQRRLLRCALTHLADDEVPAWDRRVSIPTPGGRVLHARAYVDRRSDMEGIELFSLLGPRAVADATLLAAVHVIGRQLAGEVVLADGDLDLTGRVGLAAPSEPFYRQFVDAGALADADGLDRRLARACGELDAVAEALVACRSGDGPISDEVDEEAFVVEVAEPAAVIEEPITVGEVEGHVRRLLIRFGLDVQGDDPLPLRFCHGSATVSVNVELEGGAPFVVFRARLAGRLDRSRALPFVADFNRAEEMGRFVFDGAEGVIYELALLGQDLDAGELLRGLVHAAETADDRDDALAEIGGGELGGVGDAEGADLSGGPQEALPSLVAAFDRLTGDGLLEDVDLGVAEASALVERYVRQLGIMPVIDSAGVLWIRSGSTQVGVRTAEVLRGALVAFEAPVLYDVPAASDLPAVLDELNRGVRSGAFVYDPAMARVWFRDALFANDMDLSEFARAFLDAAQVADDHDDTLAVRLGGRRTLDVVDQWSKDASDELLNGLLADLQDPAPERRQAAARSLGGHSGPRVIDGLTAALADPVDDVASAALRSLVAVPAVQDADGVVAALCGVAASPAYPAHGRRQAVGGLEILGHERALMALRSTMADPDATLRARSLRAIGGLASRGVSDAATVEGLLARLGESDPWVITEVARSLASVARSCPDRITAEAVVQGLAPLLDEAPPEARPSLYDALAQMGLQGADAVVGRAADEDPTVRAGVGRVLARCAGPAHLGGLASLATDASEEVREDAVTGLARLEGPEARAALVRVFAEDADVDVRRLALEELVARRGARDDRELRAALEAAAASDDPLRVEDGRWGLHALDLSTGEGVGGGAAGAVRRALGADLDSLLSDLPGEARSRLFVDTTGAATVAGDVLKPLAGSPRYPAYALGLVRLLVSVGDPHGVLGALAAGDTSLAAAARHATL